MRSTGKYSQTLKDPFNQNYRFCETEIFRQKIIIPSFILKVLRYHNFSETHQRAAHKLFKYYEAKIDLKIDIHVRHSFSIPEILRNTKRAPSRNFSFLFTETKRFHQRFVTPTLLYGSPIFLQPTNGRHWKFLEASETSRKTIKDTLPY